MITQEEADERVGKGWLRANMIFQVIAIHEEATKKALEEHVQNLDHDKRIKLYKKKFEDVLRLDNPEGQIKQAFSQICEITSVAKNFDELVQIMIEYGPSSVELLEPQNVKIPAGEAQSILNTISEIMHKFAAAGLGGMIFVRGGKQ